MIYVTLQVPSDFFLEATVEIVRLIVFTFQIVFGFFIISKSRKTRAKLLFPLGMLIILLGLIPLQDIIITFVVFIPYAVPNLGFFLFIVHILIVLLGIYLSLKILILEKTRSKILATLIIIILICAVEILSLIFFINYFSENPLSLLSISIEFLALFSIILLGFGFLYKFNKAKGLIRKKYLYLTVGFLIITVIRIFRVIILTAVEVINIYDISLLILINNLVFNFGSLISAILIYLGLREELETKKSLKKDIKIEGDLFRLYKTEPGEITEEAVTFYKEHEVCLVCKGKVETFNYICPNCRALYCEKCVRALSNLENACWVCSDPFDKTRPSKPFKERKEDIIAKDFKPINF